jgi:tetratricopeptide (TPR) repeat protein
LISRGIITILIFCAGTAVADDPALSLADYLFRSESYETAITEYKRYIYFNPLGDRASYAYHRIGSAYRELQSLPKAADALRNAVYTAGNDSIRDERRVDLAVILIASGNHSGAELELVRVSHFGRYSNIKKRASFFLGISCIYGYKWQEALNAYRKYAGRENADTGSKDEVDSLLNGAEGLKYKSPSLAKTLSTFVPGLGQVYAGDWKNGFNALAINGATGYWFIDGLHQASLADIITGYFLQCLQSCPPIQ